MNLNMTRTGYSCEIRVKEVESLFHNNGFLAKSVEIRCTRGQYSNSRKSFAPMPVVVVVAGQLSPNDSEEAGQPSTTMT